MSREEMHYVNRNRIRPPFPEAIQLAYFAMGCFWGAERLFWNIPGVYSTAVGYSGGHSAHPTYEDVCTGRTGHAETVQVAFDPVAVPYTRLLKAFWESHNPTTLNRQGNDCGTQYRSAIFCTSPEQLSQAQASKAAYQAAIGKRVIVTEVLAASEFFYAEDYHQQYLGKHSDGYCGLGGLGVECPGL